jgi:hypothetical protein
VAQILCGETLARALDYLQSRGIPLTREVTLTVLQLVATALAEDIATGNATADDHSASGEQERFIARVMKLLPLHFQFAEIPLPQTSPPIARISIGYEEY